MAVLGMFVDFICAFICPHLPECVYCIDSCPPHNPCQTKRNSESAGRIFPFAPMHVLLLLQPLKDSQYNIRLCPLELLYGIATVYAQPHTMSLCLNYKCQCRNSNNNELLWGYLDLIVTTVSSSANRVREDNLLKMFLIVLLCSQIDFKIFMLMELIITLMSTE